MNPSSIRQLSKAHALKLGYPVNDGLPLLEAFDKHTRSVDEVTDRLLSLHIIVACSYGFSKQQAATLLREQGLVSTITPREVAFLDAESDDGLRARIQWQVESLWALAWCLRVHQDLNFAQPCSASFVSLLPDINHPHPNIQAFRDTLWLRSPDEILAYTDLAYCLHWSVRDAQLHEQLMPGRAQVGVIIERRRALDWVVSSLAWEDVSLDT